MFTVSSSKSRLFSIASLLYIVFIILASCPVDDVDCTALHVWRGQIVYYGGDREAGLKETEEACAKLGGHLPSVHSSQDIHELIQLIGQDARLWLGAKSQNNQSPLSPRGVYEWSDGTRFDYQGWVKSYPNCQAACCGVGFTTVYEDGLVDKECKIQRRMICVMPILTNATARDWIANELSNLNLSSSNESDIREMEQQLSIDILNETMTSLQQSSGYLYTQLSRLESQFSESIRAVNASLTNNEDQLKRILLNLKESLSQKTQQASQVGQQNQTDLASLSLQVNVCMGFLAFILIVLLLIAITKMRWPSWIPFSKSNIYARFVDSRGNNLRSSSSLSSITSPNSTLGLDSIYTVPTDSVGGQASPSSRV